MFKLQIFGYLCAVESLILSGIASWPWSQYRQVPDDGSELYIEDREMTPMSPIDSSDVPNNHHQLPQQRPQNHNNCNNSVTTHSETNHHNQQNRTISSPTSYNNQKPYIPGTCPEKKKKKE